MKKKLLLLLQVLEFLGCDLFVLGQLLIQRICIQRLNRSVVVVHVAVFFRFRVVINFKFRVLFDNSLDKINFLLGLRAYQVTEWLRSTRTARLRGRCVDRACPETVVVRPGRLFRAIDSPATWIALSSHHHHPSTLLSSPTRSTSESPR